MDVISDCDGDDSVCGGLEAWVKDVPSDHEASCGATWTGEPWGLSEIAEAVETAEVTGFGSVGAAIAAGPGDDTGCAAGIGTPTPGSAVPVSASNDGTGAICFAGAFVIDPKSCLRKLLVLLGAVKGQGVRGGGSCERKRDTRRREVSVLR